MSITKNFPVLQTKFFQKGRKGWKRLVYLDNASTTLKPLPVINSVREYYENYSANVHRGMHKLSERATQKYEGARKKIAEFINAEFEETIFTRGTTESLNLLAYSLAEKIKKDDEIIVSEMEHHSNLVPWQQMAKQKKATLKFAKIDSQGRLDMKSLEKSITKKSRILAMTSVSNSLGSINNLKKIVSIKNKKNPSCLLIVDAAQSVQHTSIDVKKLGVDFLAFSGHKMYGPTGIGVLYGKKKLLEKLKPFHYGGDMIKKVSKKESVWNDLPYKFEAGTPNIAGAIGLGEAVVFMQKIGFKNIVKKEKELTSYAYKKLSQIKNVEVYGPKKVDERCCVFSFNIRGIHPHDVASILDSQGIAVRGGHHCTMPLMQILGINGTVRASFCFYNTKKDVDILVKGINHAKKIFGIE